MFNFHTIFSISQSSQIVDVHGYKSETQFKWVDSQSEVPTIDFPHFELSLARDALKLHLSYRYIDMDVIASVSSNLNSEYIVTCFEFGMILNNRHLKK